MKIMMSILSAGGMILLLAVSGLADPGIPDTVRVDSVAASQGSKVVVPVHFYNDEIIIGLEVVLKYDSSYLAFDSVSTAGGRLEGFPEDYTIIYTEPGLLDLLIFDPETEIPEGNGLLGNLFFDVSSSAGGHSLCIDTTTRIIDSGGIIATFKTVFSDAFAMPVYPQFVPGCIEVVEPPPSNDSVWVDRITGSPGEQVEINVYGYNEEAVSKINLALEYSSDSLIYDTTIFEGTRSESVPSQVQVTSQIRQLLITINYGDASPLLPGTGSLAKIVFEIAPGASAERILIDSTSYLGAQPLEFTLAGELNGLTFTPYFIYGYVDVGSGTAADDENQSILPATYALAQNVPNPFNPSTNICFDLPRQSRVRLNVFNVLGQKVRTLIDETMPAGRHSITFDGKGDDDNILASGVYFYRLEADDFSRSRKMMLMK